LFFGAIILAHNPSSLVFDWWFPRNGPQERSIASQVRALSKGDGKSGASLMFLKVAVFTLPRKLSSMEESP
jgi:hypothetical protein